MRKKPVSQKIQFIAGFLIPTIILLTLSDESRLGPLYGMVLSLAFPVAIEVYSFLTGRKASYISVVAIIGIVFIGVISLFGLSEEWLAARRAAMYLFGGLALLIVTKFKSKMIDKGVGFLIDIQRVFATAKERNAELALRRVMTRTTYGFAITLLVIGIWSYLFTLIFMTAQTGTSEFNAQYAQLRLISLPAITLPLVIVVVGLLMYLLSRIEKLTGLSSDDLVKKNKQ